MRKIAHAFHELEIWNLVSKESEKLPLELNKLVNQLLLKEKKLGLRRFQFRQGKSRNRSVPDLNSDIERIDIAVECIQKAFKQRDGIFKKFIRLFNKYKRYQFK